MEERNERPMHRKPRKKVCHFCVDRVEAIDYKDVAYLIYDEAEGYYVFYEFESEPTFPAELERIAKITDGVLRVMVIKK